jgi:hypothetical protein
MVLVLIFALMICRCILSVPYTDCPLKSEPETRTLFIATCDTRLNWKVHWALRAWNTSGHALREKGLSMINVCYGKSWSKHGFLTKPKLYKNYIQSLSKDAYVILMDSDTFWSVVDIQSIWHKFDCAREGKDVLLSTEMQCWVGRYCNEKDLTQWYGNLASTTSFSPFANSGVIMGKISAVILMLEYVIEHNSQYFVEKPGNKMRFDDQYAIADYAITKAPAQFALDYNQQLSASFSIHAPQLQEIEDQRWGFVCKRLNGSISMFCPDYTQRLNRNGFFVLQKKTCRILRKITPSTEFLPYVETLAPNPAIWHGNGVGKRIYQNLMHRVFQCNIEKRSMSEDDYSKAWK